MKYANGCLFIKREQYHAFICAKTKKRMKEILLKFNVTSNYFDDFWSPTANDKMKQIADDKEGVWATKDIYIDDYIKLNI